MDIKKISDSFSVVAQLQASDLEAVKAAGFKTLINNRPDAEDEGQPLNDDIAKKAAELDLVFYYLPVISGQVTDEAAAEFEKILAKVEAPVLAFCRSGNRCLCLWSLVNASQNKKPFAELQATAQQAGFDLTNLQARIEQRAGHA
ncbi:hypothetical protein AKN87_02015 [Thiopseudomonas alkaliphila]|uniref:TIGR01244 family phosphatase n=1 Tax=Thiopseudomonas alkaliphila TaxID=1697053 RepID=A0A0K1XBE8_9GAMM|nr:TIGR01244 family sulfur transferase [Thiopseudomonas alkaliphila]AKX44016.1 hypothetical protein AKN87_02015 [Thiopseudomonas alkaliphila]AKX46253.1 hypothetical protein AKN94_01880 [Thiopseudomonas alkaliphila]AKX49323.1 hypothetical protein AKN93_07855 [Thiopseudomonas alkaliphila]AKX52768.1 hypothetical protein AKN91_03105 [Thiopseudomonas alkaliphila]AKX54305.1 hypothetical protein AKN90_00105 [Thiopseudomonas alkaliphila]